MTVTLWAPAKLTLSLRITGVRPDGLHELEAEMVTVDLVDEILVDAAPDDPAGTSSVRVELPPDGAAGEGSVPAGAENLVSRTLELVGRQASVVLRKRIPVGGGLGGGSADAAAILRWAGCRDLGVAARLGSDVPFCLVGGRARVSGVGERVEPLPHLARRFLLLVPPLSVSTGAAYRRWDELAAAGRGADPETRNDLTPAALATEPRLAQWRDALARATGRSPHLAGSGCTWFVDGDRADLGMEGVEWLEERGSRARLLEVGTVPAGWGEPGGPTGA